MKKLFLSLTAAVMLTGCSSAKSKAQETQKAEAAAVTTAADTGAAAETTTASKTTAAKTTASKTTTTKTTTTKATASTSASTQAPTTKAAETQAHQNEPATAAPVKHYTLEGIQGPEEIPEAEWKALCKVKDKYGVDFEAISRYLCWESWPETIIEEDGTEFSTRRDPSEPINVYYVLRCGDGTVFGVYINEKTDVVVYDNFLGEKYKEQFINEAGEMFRRLVPGCKVQLNMHEGVSLPFECPADATYEEFRQAFAESGGSVTASLYVTDDIENTEELEKYSHRLHRRKRGDLGYYCRIHVNKISQENYDDLDDVFIDYPTFLENQKVLI